MDDEFALCWNNFQDNIATGFQHLYDRGDLVDVTIACDGKFLQAHKIVLAICSPYFQEMFITNPCKHPIIILKDVAFNVMSELLQFMYQGVVNVKHTELSSFMKIAQTLQIKGLATSSTQKSPKEDSSSNSNKNITDNSTVSSNNIIETKINTSSFGNRTCENSSSSSTSKRNHDLISDSNSIYSKKQLKRNLDTNEQDLSSNESLEHMGADDVFLAPIPQISMIESRYDLGNVKRETNDPGSPSSNRCSIPPPFNFDYNLYPNKPVEYPNELHMTNDYSKGAGNHMDIPPGGNITMLSSTSLLHGNCIFNRNNTVATQQGMKTYWLCKSYRITMCRARCITHQGRVISATGVHNHIPHMKSNPNTEMLAQFTGNFGLGGGNIFNINNTGCLSSTTGNTKPSHNSHMVGQNNQHQYGSQMPPSHQQYQNLTVSHQMPNNNTAALQNMMQNVFSQNNFMHLTNMNPVMNSMQQHSNNLNNIQTPASLQITPIENNGSNIDISNNRISNQTSQQQIQSPNIHSATTESSNPNNNNTGNDTNTNHESSTTSTTVAEVTSSPIEESNCNQDTTNNPSQSDIISSIAISPAQAQFKIEHV